MLPQPSPSLLTVQRAWRRAALRLQAAGIESAPLDARLLLARTLRWTLEDVLRDAEMALSPIQEADFEALVARRCERVPVAQLLGKREFWGLDFGVTPATLIPRPDSETIIEAALAELDGREKAYAILDLGTGSGCLLLSLLTELPAGAGLGIDSSEYALETARQNAVRLGVSARAQFNIGWWAQGITGKFDLIVSNPPYVAMREWATLPPEVAHYEPRQALDGGEDGLDAYRALGPEIKRVLAPQGVAVVEIGLGQAKDVTEIFAQAGLTVTGRRCDLAGIERALTVRHAS